MICSLVRRDEEAKKDSEREMLRTGVSARFPQDAEREKDNAFPQFCIDFGPLKAQTAAHDRGRIP